METIELNDFYDIDDCILWIETNKFTDVALQFPRQSIDRATSIVLLLQRQTKCKYYVTVSTMCSVDYLSLKHLANGLIQAIIHFNNVCLASFSLSDSLPVLYVFNKHYDSKEIDFIKESLRNNESNNILILYNTETIGMITKLQNELTKLKRNITFAKLRSRSKMWHFTSNVQSLIVNEMEENILPLPLGPFAVSNHINNYDLVVHLGHCDSLFLKLSCANLLEIDIKNRKVTPFTASKELRKRVSKIEKLKEKSCERIGIILTNPLPNVDYIISESKKLAKKCQKKVYIISMIQTMDEYKLGNFPQLDAYVIVNSCICTSIIESIHSHVPILTWNEYEIACGVKCSYGGVNWNEVGDELCPEIEDLEISDNSKDYQIIEAEVLSKKRWYGLEIDAGKKEPSKVIDGRKGIASEYENESNY